MAQHIVKITGTEFVTHNVKRFKVERPAGYEFIPGQATDVSINTPAWKKELRPFTFTGLNTWDHLEFTIKIYPNHNGVTNQLGKLKKGDELILNDVFGTIQYQGEGTFIAGGAGITPFIAIFRQLNHEGKLEHNKLIFSNRTSRDIILQDELTAWFGNNFINTLTREKTTLYDNSRIDRNYLMQKISNFSRYFYICGPDAMVEDIQSLLIDLGADGYKIVREQF